MNYIDRIIRENIDSEVNYINYNSSPNERESLSNNQTIRVYHGCNLMTAVRFAKEGFSGRAKANRRYAYEEGMNPVGLFVTPNFNTAKNFSSVEGRPKNANNHAKVVIEFTARVSDLDSPIWNTNSKYNSIENGEETPKPFKNKQERERKKAEYNAYDSQNDTVGYIRNSDNPSMVNSIYNDNEQQAIFIGDVDPNMIKRFWVQHLEHDAEDDYFYMRGNKYVPMTRQQFLKKYGNEEFDEYDNGNYRRVNRAKLFNPNEDFTSLEDMLARDFKQRGLDPNKNRTKFFMELQELKMQIRLGRYAMLNYLLYPKQLVQLLGKEKYIKNFDKLEIGTKNENKINSIIKNVIKENIGR